MYKIPEKIPEKEERMPEKGDNVPKTPKKGLSEGVVAAVACLLAIGTRTYVIRNSTGKLNEFMKQDQLSHDVMAVLSIVFLVTAGVVALIAIARERDVSLAVGALIVCMVCALSFFSPEVAGFLR